MCATCPPVAAADCIIEVDAAGQAPRYGGLLAFGGKVVIYGSNAPQIPPPLAR